MYESNDKMVSHPDHYQSETGLEVIDVIEAFTFDMKGIEATDTGNILKYACRWKKKNGIQDLEKILWYTQHLIDHLKKLEAENKEAVFAHKFKHPPTVSFMGQMTGTDKSFTQFDVSDNQHNRKGE